MLCDERCFHCKKSSDSEKIFDIVVADGRQALDLTAYSLERFLTIDFVYIISNLKEFFHQKSLTVEFDLSKKKSNVKKGIRYHLKADLNTFIYL